MRGKKNREQKSIKAKRLINKIKWIMIALAIVIFFVTVFFLFRGRALDYVREYTFAYIRSSYDGHLHVGDVKGNVFTGIVFEDVRFHPEGEALPQPVWSGDKITINLRLGRLLRGDISPRKVVCENFVFRFEQNPDGTFKLPPLYPQPINAQGGQPDFGDIWIVILKSNVIYLENAAFQENPLQYELTNVNASSIFKKDRDLRINNFEGTFLDCKIYANGNIDTKKSFQSELNIEFENMNLEKLSESLGRLFPTEKNTRPSGKANLNFKLTGNLLAPELEGMGFLKTLKIGNFQLDDVHLNLRYQNKYLKIEDSVAKAYNGRIALTGEIDASDEVSKFSLDAEIINFDLGLYIQNNRKEVLRPVAGMFTGKFAGVGYFNDLSSFKGNGYLECGGGMYLNPFRDAVPDQQKKYKSERLGFEKLNIDFRIENQVLDIDKFIMESRYVSIESKGGITFSGLVNVEGLFKAQSELLRSSPYFTDVVRFLPNKDVQIPVKFRMFGHFENLQIQSAIPEDMIDSLVGDDYMRREAAKKLLEKYFDGDLSSLTEYIPVITQDV